jgi:hypothetical protein
MWINTICLTFLFFLISLGFGLFILALASTALIEQCRLTRLQLSALGFTIGGPGTAAFLQLLSLVSANLGVDLGILTLTSLTGLLLTRNLWRPRGEDRSQVLLWTAVSVPVALMTWWWTFGAFSHFPFTDIGADVHWMQTAQEYADTGILNPYASQSYIDLRTALAGILSAKLGLSLLQFNWTYRYFSILFLMIFFYAVADGIFADRGRKWFAFFLAGTSNVLGLLTNGSLAVASSLVFLTTRLMGDVKAERPRVLAPPTLLAAGGALLSIVLAFLLNNNALMLAVLAATALAFNVLNRMGNAAKNLASYTFVSVTWSMALMLAHRGASLFVPTAIFGWLFYIAAFQMVSRASFLTKLLRALVVLLPLICLAILTGVLAGRLGYLPSMNAAKVFSYITVILVGKPIEPGDDIILGAGPEAAAIEIGRAIGPLFTVGTGLMMAWWCATRLPESLTQSTNSASKSRNTTLLLWSWIMACGLCVTVLSGFPFLYRMVFVILGLFTVTVTELFFQLFVDPVPAPVRQRRIVAVMTVAVGAFLVAIAYSFAWPSNLPYGGYLAILRPFEVTGVALILVLAALTFVPSRRLQIVALAGTISLSIAIDRSGVSGLFKTYTYGRLPDSATAVSHYDESDLKTARWLRDNMRESIIVSDPYTLGFAKAITGAPGIYLFSNLDTVSEAAANQVKRVISAIAEPGNDATNTASTACASLAPLLTNLNQEALTQMTGENLAEGILKRIRPKEIIDEKALIEKAQAQSVDDIIRAMRSLTTPTKKWNVVAIINPRTIQWIHLTSGQRPPYFPDEEPLNPGVMMMLREGPFHTVFSDNQNAIVSIQCTEDVLRSNSKAF